ncbi:MAG: cobalamin biosynthesis protein CobQ [Patescibacteria group bacterium]
MKFEVIIGWLYPELMSTYGDRGNIICLQKRCEWQGIKVEVKKLDLGFKIYDLRKCDLIFMGGAQDKQQKIVSHDFSTHKVNALKDMIEDDIPGLYICGAYQFLGKYYKETDGTIVDGLNILDLYTENPGEKHRRLIGNIVIQTSQNVILVSEAHPESLTVIRDSGQARMTSILVGFENHGGRTYLGKKVRPFATVLKGFGNNGMDKTEGAVYKNSFGSYLHGPILPKNPHFADLLIKLALEKKYKESINLSPLDDSLEWQSHNAIAKRMGVAI